MRLASDPQLMVARHIKDFAESFGHSDEALAYQIKVVRNISSQEQYIILPDKASLLLEFKLLVSTLKFSS